MDSNLLKAWRPKGLRKLEACNGEDTLLAIVKNLKPHNSTLYNNLNEDDYK
jgi:hypothetical protein